MWWHVIWTTFKVPLPADERGDWTALSQFYAEVAAAEGPIAMSAQLATQWQAKPVATGAIALSTHARQVVADSILDLAANDRVAGELRVRVLDVGEQAVHVLVESTEEGLSQRIGRLKSRTATLLSFDAAAGVGGKGTWSRGFWWASLPTEGSVERVAAFVRDGVTNVMSRR